MKCNHCGATENLIKGSLSRGKSYYICNPCNTERSKRYRETEAGRMASRRAGKRTTSKYLYKQKARLKVAYQLKIGNIKRLPCNVCGIENTQAHHTDYNDPLNVVWLCITHHAQVHKRI